LGVNAMGNINWSQVDALRGHESVFMDFGGSDYSSSLDLFASTEFIPHFRGFPSPATLMSNYPDANLRHCGLKDECAIRMSIAFEKSGADILGSDKFRDTHNHNGVIHQPSADALADWLSSPSQLGPPKIYTHPTGRWAFDDFKYREGIIYFPTAARGGNGHRHIDVISGGKIGSGFGFNKVVWFWEFLNGSYVKNR
jgi:hypothetical protein